jgi:hypothetical protein
MGALAGDGDRGACVKMRRGTHELLFTAAITAALAGCGQSRPVTGDDVLAAMQQAGIQYSNVNRPAPDPFSPLPNSYKERVTFALPGVAPRGGQILVCEKREYCDAIYSYFDAFKALAGPYLYRSKNGLVVAQVNSGLEPAAAQRVQRVIEALPTAITDATPEKESSTP